MAREGILVVVQGGAVFGRWTVLGEGTPKTSREGWKSRRVLCRCSCGTERSVKPCDLVSGKSKSCGICTNPLLKHGLSLEDGKPTPEFQVWQGMKDRCLNPGCESYPRYGGRGITICARWLESYANFLADLGKRPSPTHSIDRRDNNGNYEPGNCRWATKKEQIRNRRNTWKVDGRPLAEICEELGLKYVTVQGRIRSGWPKSDWFIPVGRRP